MTQVQEFDPHAFKNRVKAHITNSFGSLLPEAQFTAMIEAEIKEFFETPRELIFEELNRSGWSQGEKIAIKSALTPFQQMVWRELTKLVSARLDKYMKDDNTLNPINKMLDELFTIPEFEDHQVLTAQKMMLAMAGQFFSAQLNSVGRDAKNSIAYAFQNAGMPDIAYKINEHQFVRYPT